MRAVTHRGSSACIHPNISMEGPPTPRGRCSQPEGHGEAQKIAPASYRIARCTRESRREIAKLKGRHWILTIIAAFVIQSLWIGVADSPLCRKTR